MSTPEKIVAKKETGIYAQHQQDGNQKYGCVTDEQVIIHVGACYQGFRKKKKPGQGPGFFVLQAHLTLVRESSPPVSGPEAGTHSRSVPSRL